MKKSLLTIGIVFLCYFCRAQSYLPLTGGTLTGPLIMAPSTTASTINQTIGIQNSTGQTAFGGYLGQRVISSNNRQGLVVSGTGSLTVNAQTYNIDFITGAITPSDDTNLRMRILSNGYV